MDGSSVINVGSSSVIGVVRAVLGSLGGVRFVDGDTLGWKESMGAWSVAAVVREEHAGSSRDGMLEAVVFVAVRSCGCTVVCPLGQAAVALVSVARDHGDHDVVAFVSGQKSN